MPDIARDASRPSSVAAIRDLLSGSARHPNPVVGELAPNMAPIVLIAPEYAFGSGDWEALDLVVRASPRPVVLVAGFGAALGSTVLDWADAPVADGATQRHRTWTPSEGEIARTRPVNGAWCWIHGFGGRTQSYVLLKNHLEQRVESVSIPDLQLGRTVAQILFNDCDLLPLICADLVQSEADGTGTALRRLERALEPRRGQGAPVLVTGSLYQTVPSNENWAVAIATWLSTVTRDRRALLALANVAIDKPVAQEAADQWRSLTGAFCRLTDIPRNQAALPVVRPVNAQGFRGVVLRRTDPFIACGPLIWSPYRPTGDQFYWRAGAGMPLEQDGISAPVVRPAEAVHVEVARFVGRARSNAPACPRTRTGFGALADHVDAEPPHEREQLFRSVLHGLDRTQVLQSETFGDEPQHAALMAGLHAVATLAGSDAIGWRTADGQDGQFRVDDQDLNILVWRDARLTPRLILHEIGAWAAETDPHPRLTVLANGPHGSPPPGLVEPHPRDVLSDGPAANADLGLGGSLGHTNDDFTQTRVRQVACIGLGVVAEVYVDFQPEKDADRMDALMSELIRYFPTAA